ncbi:DHA1 family bicyclomycin/chloramphenicol resistance-like MFS transporter [Defluviimonas denitrificans]|jgi:DHA1 family bicyclomycin/chloramphenicol resistance-like MFS transporter|uniref:Bcr/CflA family efflux transporter n=1 Tax=Albidovulum denitrificans TaxID=404881 RepID=A0A2S8SBY5_9RHOB|nr:multidrug effflux MFS transporter [Defluviimonas denitrificans]PQV58314.1 DHA1 family bicyclomycin/chloramphenicol resistance-like MFS transporter [Defluviimonas denitrificans]
MRNGLFRSALVLGLLSCIGPFSIDMYLPAMPQIARGLNADVAGVQTTISAYFLAFGIAQLVYGPWADQSGRKPPLYLGVAIYLIGTAGCYLAPSIGALIGWRFVQALGAAAVMVVPRAIIRDMHTGHEATRMMAAIMLVISVSPMLAPLAGSAVIAVADWRAIFGVLAIAGLLSLLMIAFLLPETLRPEDRVPVSAGRLLSGARHLLGDRVFMGLTFTGGFGMASFFVFLASASFVYTGQFGLTPTQFSLAFAANAIGFFSASQMAATLGQRFGARRVVLWATAGFAVFALLTLAVVAAGIGGLPLLIAGLFMGNACLGLVIPTTMVMALDPHGEIAGLASSLGGTLQMLAGGAVVMLSGPFFDGTAVPMVAAIAACALAALALALWVLLRPLPAEIA